MERRGEEVREGEEGGRRERWKEREGKEERFWDWRVVISWPKRRSEKELGGRGEGRGEREGEVRGKKGRRREEKGKR